MFKVPDWGNDIPKGDVEVVKLFGKKNKKKTAKNNVEPKIKNDVKNKESNFKNKKNALKKAKAKVNGHVRLTKDEHISNRISKRNQKNNFAETRSNDGIQIKSTTGCTIVNTNKFHNNNVVTNKLKRKTLIRKNKFTEMTSSNKTNGTKKTEKNNSIENSSVLENNKGKKQKKLKRKQVQIDKTTNNIDINSLNNEEPNEVSFNAKRKKFNDEGNEKDMDHNDEKVKVEPKRDKRIEKKKEKLKELLEKASNRNVIRTNSNGLRERMLERLKAAQFRFLNEKLYTASGSESQELFKSDPEAFQTYHEGYQQQLKKWPVNPLDIIVKRIQKMPKTSVIADMGCGEAALAKRVPHTVRSFDLVAACPQVEACDMAHTPLPAGSVDAAVYCLALMGTDIAAYLREANRVLKSGGHLLIAEVESRFDDAEAFSSDVQRLGFGLKRIDRTHEVFLFFEFTKLRDASTKKNKLPTVTLKPCLYKKR